MMDDQLFYLIKDVGVPALLCIYMMTFGVRTIQDNSKAIKSLKNSNEEQTRLLLAAFVSKK